MTDTNGSGVLRRMLGEGGRPPPPPLTVHRALRLALGQLADERFDIEIEVRGIEDQPIGQEALGALRLAQGVYFLTEGPRGAVGLAAVSRDLIAALIEVQTTGRISPAPGPERAPTPTDAAMVEGYLDAVLIRLGTMLSAVEGEEWTRGQRLGRAVFDLHQIPLELPDIAYRMLRATIGFAPDGKEGELVIVLPARPMEPEGADLGTQAADAARLWHRRLTAAVEASPVELQAVLHRLALPVAQVRALRAGEVLRIPARSVRNLAMVGSDQRTVAHGRLGMANGMKAVRVAGLGPPAGHDPAEEPPDPASGDLPQLDLDGLGLGDMSDPLPALDAPSLADAVVTPEDLPDLGDFPALASADGLSADGTIPLDDLPELDGELPPLDIKPMTVEID